MHVKGNISTIIFACVLGIICASLLSTVSQYTKPYREENEKLEKVLNFLEALEVPINKELDAKGLLNLYVEKVTVKELGTLTLYEYSENESGTIIIKSIAVNFTGAGLWGPIEGVIAFEPDLKTIRGIRFYRQEETPGLGGEIGSEWFQDQFKNKQIATLAGIPGFTIIKPGRVADINSVDGISGATMTCDKVQLILRNLFTEIWKERDNYVQ